jgi:acyl-CoA thioesterase-1
MIRAGAVLFLILTLACAPAERAHEAERMPAATSAPAASVPVASRPRIVALGDSLTAGLGLSPAEAYPALLQERLDREGLRYEVVNAGVSGDTSAGGLRRVDWALEGDVKVLIVALGGNDALRGLPIEQLRDNLAEIITRAKRRGITVILAGMEAPPNFGAGYTVAFRQAYRDLAKDHDVVLVPFLLDGVAGLPHMNQTDGIHPTADGAHRVADNIWSALQPIVKTE